MEEDHAEGADYMHANLQNFPKKVADYEKVVLVKIPLKLKVVYF